jgi:hypothetical protein
VAKGDVIIVRYADDLVMGFQHRAEAVRFLEEFKERLRKFGLELHPEKTRLIEFGRYAAHKRKQWGKGKPETFTFLGFTHYCGRRHKTDTFTVWRITSKQRMVAKLKAIKVELLRRKHDRISQVGAWLRKVATGYYIPCCSRQHRSVAYLQATRESAVAERSGSSQSTRQHEVGVTHSGLRQVDTRTPNPAPLSSRPLQRHSSFIRAVCVDALVRICAGGAQ